MLTLAELDRAGYRTVAIATPDAQGRLVGREVPLRRFLDHPDEGVEISSFALTGDLVGVPLFDSPFSGPHTGYHDVRLRPDLATLRPYPAVDATAICFADVVDGAGIEQEVAPRTVLRRQVERAHEMGFTVRLATELEFYLFWDDPREARRRGYRGLEPTTPERATYSVTAVAAQHPFLQPLQDAMAAAGIPVASAQTEAGRGQWEVNLEHAEPMDAADRHVLLKAGIREVARQASATVTFMARPVPDDLGSSCHIHCSLRTGDDPAFPVAPESGELSETARHFAGGLLAHLPATAVFFAPYANSYKRFAPGFAAGQIAAWGGDNRSVAIRAVGKGQTLRLEHRTPGADANPYLAAAAVIAAGLEGIQAQRDPGPPVEGDADARADLPRTPCSLGEALSAFEAADFVKQAFGADVAAHYAAHARAEWQAYLVAVTDWEIMRGFEAV